MNIEAFVEDQELRQRIQVWRGGECAEQARCVLYWMQRAQRGRDNHALHTALVLANRLGVPVIVLFVLTDYPGANLRHYTFLLEGLAVVADQLQERGMPFVIRRGVPAVEVTKLAQDLGAAALLSDVCELRVPRAWRTQVQARLQIPFLCVDTDTVVPLDCIPKEEYAARTIRPKIHRLLPTFLQPMGECQTACPLAQPPCDPGETRHPLRYLDSLPLERNVPPSQAFHGGYREGQKRVQRLLQERLQSYAERRNHPELAGTGELSAYLHFGHISVQQLAWEVEQFRPDGPQRLERSEGQAAYLEELIVRRELAMNFAYYNPHYDTLEGCPDWGRKTLQKHANDPREWIYTRQEFEAGQTHDELWNACQREMVVTGRMHGYMRMYWGKKILEWSATPEEAFHTAVFLNDTYELDGRDASGYVGISWSIGGRHDRPWKERPIFGMIRYMSEAGMKRKCDTQAYIQQWQAQKP